MNTFRKLTVTAVGTVALFAAACGNDSDDETSSSDETTETTETETTEAPETTAEPASTEPTGPACGAVPADGEGSFSGMADDPAATAASNNPELSTLVEAVGAAGLVDTLNSEGPFTIFAPVNSAFAKIPAADLQAVLADTELLSSILTLHVVQGEQLDAAALSEMDSVATVNGQEITLEASGDSVMVNGQASVVCANVPTGNATVHLIDSVLMPAAG